MKEQKFMDNCLMIKEQALEKQSKKPNDSNDIESTHSFDIQQFLAYRLNILAKRMSVAVSDIYMSEFDISIPEWRTLLWVHSNLKVYARDISFHCLMDKTQVSRVISNLKKRGLITRKVDDKDQRSQILSLTEDGKALIEKIIPKATQLEDDLFSILTKQQYDDFFKLIDSIEKRMIEYENDK